MYTKITKIFGVISEEFKQIEKDIFRIDSSEEFDIAALRVFKLQYRYNKTYHQFVDLLKINVQSVETVEQIPFLPISFFKNKKIIVEGINPEIIFLSSSTTGTGQSQHFVAKTALYEESFLKAFCHFYGDIKEYTIFALLPSYLEREGSSLVYMAGKLIQLSENSKSGFYLYNHKELLENLSSVEGKKIVLGVSFALLDLAEKSSFQLKDVIIMETGGMKGRKEELTREELHTILIQKFGVNSIHSEYGMTELLSQAYSKQNGIYQCPPWMKVLARDTTDPLKIMSGNKSGCLNIIDLANLYSCSFIATQDLGKVDSKGFFEVTGRMDNSDIRGCNLMAI